MGLFSKLKNMSSEEDDAMALGFVGASTAGVWNDNDGEDAGNDDEVAGGDSAEGSDVVLE